MAAATVRPLVTVQSLDGNMTTNQTTTLPLPDVTKAPVRPDVVNHVHAQISNNSRQPYAVSKLSGCTHRAGQVAFGNMCRGCRMFALTKIYRRWHRSVNLNLKRHAIVSAIAARLLFRLF
ncbi:hypothetical protein CARUB_v10025452mg [Capsella rubella]|uniref:Uncharacterized protein n=1 Tax=Capsella rubella TaxID=81985 RepID=R0HUU0_9BRAS|nr:hypothetical protein CARUB_v10025452mg [Capsella rubella]